jgi:hypothetical protein
MERILGWGQNTLRQARLGVLFAVVQLAFAGVSKAPAQGITQDLSHGTSFKFKIAASLPEFTFKIIPESSDADDHTKAQSTVRDIEVFRGHGDKPLQHLEDCEWGDMDAPPKDSPWFRAEDVNFDGYSDIYLLTQWGATGNQYGCVWLYNPATGRFDYSKEFSALPRYWLEPATKTILTFDNGGMTGLVHDANRYRVENNIPVLIWHEHQDWDSDKKQLHCVVEERKGAAMLTSKDQWSQSGADWSGVVAPCDPGKLFP